MAKELPFQYWLKPIAKSISELNTKYAELTVKISQIESGSSTSSGSGSSGTGEAGVGIASLVQTTTSSVSDGANVWTATLTDGSKYTLTVRNGSQGEQGEPGSDGVGISSIQQTVVSSVSGGRNTITVTLTDGSTKNLYVYNGAQGEPGADAEGGSLPDASEYDDGYILMVQDGEWALVSISEYVGESSGTSVETATGATEGVVKLSDSVTSDYGVNSGYAATPSAVKEAYDYADEAYARAQDAYNLANESGTNASTALSTANTASANASTALSTANTASANASTALSTANTASANASTALSTANEALDGLDELRELYDELVNQFIDGDEVSY